MARVECSHCNGTGMTFMPYEECYFCDGTGYREVEDEAPAPAPQAKPQPAADRRLPNRKEDFMTIGEIYYKQEKDQFEDGFRWHSENIVIEERGIQNDHDYIVFNLTDYGKNTEYQFKAFVDVPLPFSGTSYRSGNYRFVFELQGPKWCAVYHLVEVEDLNTHQKFTTPDEALYQEGWTYWEGKGVKEDIKKAEECWQKAANMGHARAQCQLGNVLYGNFNRVEAAVWWRKAAAQGNTDAQQKLQKWDHEIAEAEAKAKAPKPAPAPQGNPNVASDLHNNGVAAYKRKDYAEAVRCWQKAADQGNAKAQWDLGVCYNEGLGITKDAVKGCAMIDKAQKQGVDPGVALLPNGGIKTNMTFEA